MSVNDSVNAAGGFSVGDAVFSFIADTQQLDQGVAGLQTRIESGMAGAAAAVTGFNEELDATGENAMYAGEVIQDSMHRSSASIREAKGEAMLLGEAFGVHLPRHVTGFIAKLPGVGEALSAAFAATAVLFIIEAVVKLTEKVTDFIDTTFIFTQAMKDMDQVIITSNTEIVRHTAAMKALQQTYDEIGLDSSRKLTLELNQITDSIKKQEAALIALKNTTVSADAVQESFWGGIKTKSVNALEWIFAPHALEARLTEEAAERVRLAEAVKANAVKKAQDGIDEARKTAATKEKELILEVTLYQKKANDELKAIEFAKYEDHIHTIIKQQEADKAYAEWFKTLYHSLGTDGIATGINNVNLFTAAVMPAKNVLIAGAEAAHKFGITIQSDLIGELNAAKKALLEMANSGLVADKDLKTVEDRIKDLDKQIAAFGKEAPKEAGAFADAWSRAGKSSSEAMWGFADAYGQSIAKFVAGEESLGAAMMEATKAFIMQIGERALVQGMFYLAQGVADVFWNPARAGADFAAAGEFLALGGAAVAVGSVIPGGGATATGTTATTTNTVSAATQPQQMPTQVAGVQSFAGGGLISKSTLAVLGDSKSGGDATEGVLPLEDDRAMSQIAEAITRRMGGGGSGPHITVHVDGMISPDNLTKVIDNINKRVRGNQSTLHSSSSLRLNKRSQ